MVYPVGSKKLTANLVSVGEMDEDMSFIHNLKFTLVDSLIYFITSIIIILKIIKTFLDSSNFPIHLILSWSQFAKSVRCTAKTKTQSCKTANPGLDSYN